jgi:hypothetical protein
MSGCRGATTETKDIELERLDDEFWFGSLLTISSMISASNPLILLIAFSALAKTPVSEQPSACASILSGSPALVPIPSIYSSFES